MNTTGVQNYLSNVFRPIYTFDTTTSNFTPRLELSNVDIYSGNTLSVFTAAVGDANSNVYVGSNAGNPFNITRGARNITALGYGAASNISNNSNSVYIGYYAGANISNSTDVISIGTNSVGGGSANIFLGTETGTVGSSNILIGHYITLSNVSNQIRIGYRNQIPIAADMCRNWVGLGGVVSPVDASNNVDVSGNMRIQGNLGIRTSPNGRTLDISGSFRSLANGNSLDFSGSFLQSTGGFVSTQGTISAGVGNTTIGTLKRGIIHVSAVDQSSSANRAAYTYFAWTTSNTSSMSSSINGDTNIATSGTNIQLVNITSTKTYNYSITYFPLP